MTVAALGFSDISVHLRAMADLTSGQCMRGDNRGELLSTLKVDIARSSR